MASRTADAEQRAREHAAACLDYMLRRRDLRAAATRLTTVDLRALDDDDDRRGNPNLPVASARDLRGARRKRRDLLAPEKLPPNLFLLQKVRSLLQQGPQTRYSLMQHCGLSMSRAGDKEDLAEVLEILTAGPDARYGVIGERHKNGNRITIYGEKGRVPPFAMLEPDDAEGLVAETVARHDGVGQRYLLTHAREIIGPQVGPQTIKSSLKWLQAQGQVERRNGVYYALVG
jgi:hypothetical protein